MQCNSLRSIHCLSLVLSAAICIAGSASRAEVINIEIDPRDPPDPVYVGDDGVLSTTGGTVWNHLGLDFLNDVSKDNLLDEFGQPTDVDVTFDATGSFDANFRPIELYAGGGTGILEIKSLDPTLTYDLAVYTTNANLSMTATDANGSTVQSTGATFDIELPGDQGEEYVLFTGLVPFDLGGSILGLRIETGGGGRMAGLQLRSIPEPGGATLLMVAILALQRRPS